MRREVIVSFLFTVKPLFLALVLDQEQGEQAIAGIGLGGIVALGLVGHRQEVTERAVAPAEGTQPLLDAGDQVEQALETITGDRAGWRSSVSARP